MPAKQLAWWASVILEVKLDIAFFYITDFAEEETEKPTDYCGEDKVGKKHSAPLHDSD